MKSFTLRAIGASSLTCALMLACSGSDSVEPPGPQVPAGILLVPNAPAIPQGLSLKLAATVVDNTGREIPGRTVVFASSDESILTVATDGTMHSVGPLGTARVTADLDGLTNSVDVQITQRIVGIGVQPESLVVNLGLSAFLQVALEDFDGNLVFPNTPISFTSHNTSLVTVTNFGQVQAGNVAGTTAITVAVDTFQVDVPVRVGQIPAVIITDPVNVVLQPGGSRQLDVTVLDQAARPIPSPALAFTTTAPAIFSVSSTGLVTSLGLNGNGSVKVQVEQLEKDVGVFVGNATPVAVTHTTQIGTAGYEADIGPAGELVISEPSTSQAVRGTLPSTTLTTTLGTSSTPLGVAVNHAGTRAYVASGNELSVLDLVNNQTLPPIHVDGGGTKIGVVISNDDQRAYLGTQGYVYVIDLSSSTVIDSVRCANAFFLALHPTLPRLYSGEGTVREIDLTSMTVARTFVGGIAIKELAVSADGAELYAADEAGGFLQVFNITTGMLSQSIPVQSGAFGLAASSHLIAVTSGTGLALFDRATKAPITTISLGGQPRRPAISADETIIVVPNEGGWVDYIQ
jgi:hypothetical protein